MGVMSEGPLLHLKVEASPHFIVKQLQGVRSSIEDFDPLGVELCRGGEIRI